MKLESHNVILGLLLIIGMTGLYTYDGNITEPQQPINKRYYQDPYVTQDQYAVNDDFITEDPYSYGYTGAAVRGSAVKQQTSYLP